ncbi:MAG: hypothetical protein M1812_004606 [Candelaria pacifica]|nr:MAG: hypothetical protein M1812_004606 [Candelaria pacifica]
MEVCYISFVPATDSRGILSATLKWLTLENHSLPGAIGMYGLSLGVSHIGKTLPLPVYALLSGLNAATVGIIALAAVQLAQKAITDKLTRALVFFGGTAGMLYTALWYFPILMVASGIMTVIWDFRYPHKLLAFVRPKRGRLARETNEAEDVELSQRVPNASNTSSQQQTEDSIQHRRTNTTNTEDAILPSTNPNAPTSPSSTSAPTHPAPTTSPLSIRLSLTLLILFLLTFLTLMLLRGFLHPHPILFSLFANLFLGGTIIFGGGPVVIPLLREYTVAPGFVSARDFLLGLAIIQAFPGPNFNFAVYLGSLTALNAQTPSISGAILGFLAIFLPGLVVQTGFMGIWPMVRKKRVTTSALRGVHAGAVGLVFTAVYRLWQIGFLEQGKEMGSPLGDKAWWVVVTATSFVGGRWFGVKAPVAILLGGVMGMLWFGVVRS